MRGLPYPLAHALLLLALGVVVPGCSHDDENKPAAQTAENALGINPDNQREKTVETTRDVTVVKDTKVIDNATGETISEKKEVTPVQITKEKEVKTDVKVNVGETRRTP